MCSDAHLQEASLKESGTLGAGQSEICDVERDWDNLEWDDWNDPDEYAALMYPESGFQA